ncbi:MAG TPA: TonB-dependent receptor [Candidatus Sulfotelmatobacter sp.]|nr:TonB-dependent receptor [Candidatus Sulfotelmatobacter sp.]
MKRFCRLIAMLFVTMAIVSVPSLIAQTDTGTLSGHVMDPSGSLLQGAQIQLQPGGRTAVSDQTGGYFINGLTPGNYTISVSYVGFAAFKQSVDVTANHTTIFDVKMQVASQKDQIIVTAEGALGEAEQINREKSADNVLQVISSEVIMSLPNANIADAVGRLPSVSLERDEGEGKYIQVRSMEPRLTNATIDGVEVPSPEPGVRQIKFDAMPAGLVESVEVNKTLQANMNGDGIGGSVNIVTKTAGERPTLDLFGSGGSTAIEGGRSLGLFGGTIGERFGTDKRWGALLGGTFDFNNRGINDIEPVPDVATLPNGSTTRWFDTQDIREYAYFRSRWGLTGSVDYKLGEGSDIYVRGIYSSFKDYGNKWVYTLTDNTPGIQLLNSAGCSTDNNNNTVAPCSGVPAFSESNRVPVFDIGSLVLGGKHVLTTTWIAWDVSVGRSEELKSGGNEGADFAYNGSTSTCQFSPALTTHVYVPQWTPNCFAQAYQPPNYSLTDITTSFGQSPQLNLQASAAVGKRYELFGHLSTIEIGGRFRNAHKFDDSYTPVYDPNGTLSMEQFLGNYTNNNYYSGNYQLGPVTQWSKLLNYLNANPSAFTLQPGTVGPNPGNFDLVEQVSAGYVMDTIDFSKFRIVAGLRIEGTDLTTYTYQCDATCVNTPTQQGAVNLKLNGSYVNFLPSASFQYKLDSDTNIRVVYSRALSRPDPQDIAQAFSVTLNQNPNLLSLGNANLKAEKANNYDVLIEHHLKPYGIIQGGFFYKQLYLPIVSDQIYKQNYNPDPSNPLYPTGDWLISQSVNAGTGWLAGFEAAYLQQFTSLPGALSGLGLSANYSFTDSAACGLPGRSDCPRLLRQAPNVFNISPTFNRNRLALRVGMTYNQASIYQYQYQDGTGSSCTCTGGSGATPGGLYGPNGDNYLYSHFQLDAQGSYRLNYGFTVMAYGMNLTNEVFGFYNGQKQYLTQREYYGPTFAVGLRWSPTHEKN